MATTKARHAATATQESGALAPYRKLTWKDLEAWAGARAVDRGRSYWAEGKVHGLAQTPEGQIVAEVQGETTYLTLVGWQDGHLVSACTCPVHRACKHAVAIVLQCLDHMSEDRPVPQAAPEARRPS
jgi:uncharacterized Zn finger protein